MYWDPWSLRRIHSSLICGCDSGAFFKVRMAGLLPGRLSVTPAMTLRSYKLAMLQLQRASPFFKNRYVKSVHRLWFAPVRLKLPLQPVFKDFVRFSALVTRFLRTDRGIQPHFCIHVFMYGNRAVMTAPARQIDSHGPVSRHPVMRMIVP